MKAWYTFSTVYGPQVSNLQVMAHFMGAWATTPDLIWDGVGSDVSM